MHKLSNPTQSPQKLTQSVLQMTEYFEMYQAELARILQLQCSDIGALASRERYLMQDTPSWKLAVLFVRLYDMLYEKFNGNEAAICHWLRADNKDLKSVPLYLMVDHGQLETVIEHVMQ
jgi:hypothetical protein